MTLGIIDEKFDDSGENVTDVVININNLKKKENTLSPNTIKNSGKNIVNNMLRACSQSSLYSFIHQPTNRSPESESVNSKSPQFERKPYELNEIGSPELWTTDIVQQIMDFGDICEMSSKKCKTSSIFHKQMGNFIQLLVILIGSMSAVLPNVDLNDKTKLFITLVYP